MTDTGSSVKRILVLSRNDPAEAMRVAAGLTIFGHQIDFVFMHRVLTEEQAGCEQAELLELCEITPQTTVVAMQEHFTLLDDDALATLITRSDSVISL